LQVPDCQTDNKNPFCTQLSSFQKKHQQIDVKQVQDQQQDEFTISNLKEIKQYFNEDNIEFCINSEIFLLWQQNSFILPILSALSKLYLSILSSNADSERVCSDGSLVVSEKKQRLSQKKAKMLVTLKGNQKYLENIQINIIYLNNTKFYTENRKNINIQYYN
ncbi:hAT family dimerization protein, partial (macronuclear) [Tetrahymena thermophila SB210]